ncbi:pyridoxal phosphate-dependent aminotransferase [Roseateles violae]|uniref:histidinol-phosphate transaminase n=1 Tax=Roseateles violae TaxID=3058042 RepID=A0ABT8DYE6_9BURK|nr:aminotransferase class I/II-fold pyridoxal phosphate-dependent enzyme [Pelomonas sp. PFR6]MDN3922396.1 aminotransferase class I/II-fold pyridoxal phosphate-dependent enzyme [Pelomonas sp. PFR6]
MNSALHGGTDSGPAIVHDFSSNANPLGPPPRLWRAVLDADRRRYPDPQYLALCDTLAAAHGVEPDRILPAAGGAEAIRRLSLAARLRGIGEVWVPRPGFGDYATAAGALGMEVRGYRADELPRPERPALIWACEPNNPCGGSRADLAALAGPAGSIVAVDLAYAPLCLQGEAPALPAHCWRLVCPNKALGLCGVRAAYLIAPAADEALRETIQSLAASWLLSAEGVAMLSHWQDEDTQAWLADSRAQLRQWKAQQRSLLAELGWQQGDKQDSCTPFWLARPGKPLPPLRERHGIKLRDAASFGLPSWVRIATLPPASQQALIKALRTR